LAFGLLISDHEHGWGLLKSKHVSEKFEEASNSVKSVMCVVVGVGVVADNQ
jgi:hypothetical protein